MALRKFFTTEAGATGDYWTIVADHAERLGGDSVRLHCTLALFASEEAAELPGAQAIGCFKIFSAECTKLQAKGDRKAILYAAIKAANDPDLAEAVDA